MFRTRSRRHFPFLNHFTAKCLSLLSKITDNKWMICSPQQITDIILLCFVLMQREESWLATVTVAESSLSALPTTFTMPTTWTPSSDFRVPSVSYTTCSISYRFDTVGLCGYRPYTLTSFERHRFCVSCLSTLYSCYTYYAILHCIDSRKLRLR